SQTVGDKAFGPRLVWSSAAVEHHRSCEKCFAPKVCDRFGNLPQAGDRVGTLSNERGSPLKIGEIGLVYGNGRVGRGSVLVFSMPGVLTDPLIGGAVLR